jgi:Tol biopolymer transport system component
MRFGNFPILLKKSLLPLALSIGLAVAVCAASTPQNSAQYKVLFEKAKFTMETKGDLKGAIALFEEIIQKFPNERDYAAKSLYLIGTCYEKLGRDEARNAYERLLREYADQNEAATQARKRLAALSISAGVEGEQGLAARQIWTGSDIDFEGSPSPDGRYLSFVDWETGDLALRDLQTGTNRRLTNKGPWEKSEEFAEFSRWSPDGKLIAYDWYDGNSSGSVDLHVITPRGGKPRVLVDNSDGEWMQTYDWSPDSKRVLVFLEKKDGTLQIVLVSAADGTTEVIKTFERPPRLPGRFPQAMCFSRDGRYIVYDRPQEEGSPQHDIFLLSIEGNHETSVVTHPADDRLLGWPPDSGGILFASDRTGSLDIWFLPVSDGRPQGEPDIVKGGVEKIVPMGFTRTGAFCYAQGQLMLDVYVAKIDPKSIRILAPAEKAIQRYEGANSWPDYSPDGKSLAYVSTRIRSYQSALSPNILCIRSLETGKEQEFSTKFRRLAGTRWSPDGRLLYLAAWDNQGMGIYRVDAQNGEFSPIVRTEPPASLHRHEISPDGKVLIYGWREKINEPYRIMSRNLATGEEKQLLSGDKNMFSISPDGRWLALINLDKEKVLRIMPLGGGEPRELLRFEDRKTNHSVVAWTVDGKYIIFEREHHAKDPTQSALWRIAVKGGEPQELNLVMAAFQDLSVHPDGQHLVFDSLGRVIKTPTIWVMENFLPREKDRALSGRDPW